MVVSNQHLALKIFTQAAKNDKEFHVVETAEFGEAGFDLNSPFEDNVLELMDEFGLAFLRDFFVLNCRHDPLKKLANKQLGSRC